jgi:histone H3/H4
MFSYLTGELVRPRQDDLLATARYQRLVREAGAGRPHRVRHAAATLFAATARRLEPIRRNLEHEAASVAPELPCAISPC